MENHKQEQKNEIRRESIEYPQGSFERLKKSTHAALNYAFARWYNEVALYYFIYDWDSQKKAFECEYERK